MPYIQRDEEGRIVSLHAACQHENQEYLPADHVQVLAFLISSTQSAEESVQAELIAADLKMVRVIEDLIALLIDKNIIMFTELPAAAREKILMRRSTRERLSALLPGTTEPGEGLL